MGPTSVAPDELDFLHQHIYFIVAYCTPEKKHRCFGYYTSYNVAKTALETKWKNIEECMYDSFFIEEMKEGLHSVGVIKDFYTILDNKRELIKVSIPENIKKLTNWSIG